MALVDDWLQAALEGDLDKLKDCEKKGVDVRLKDQHGNTALHLAALFSGNVEVVEYLLELGRGRTLKDIKEEGGDLDLEITVAFLDLINSKGQDGRTPLLCTAEKGHLKVLQRLVGLGADIRAENDTGNTALHYAAYSGNEEVVEYLVELGKEKKIGKLGLEIKNQYGRTPLLCAAEKGHLKVLQRFVSLGANVRVKDQHGNTALHLAALFSGSVEVVEYLVELGRQKRVEELGIEVNGRFGKTPLLCAAEKGQLKVLQRLVELGANVRTKDNDGDTVLHWAALFSGSEEVVEYLVGLGRQSGVLELGLESKGHLDKTPLLYAAEKAQLKVLQRLVLLGADIRATTADGSNALHMACYSKSLATVKYVVEELGLDVKSKDRGGSGYTVIDVAKFRVSKEQKSSDIIAYLDQKSEKAKRQRAYYLEQGKYFRKQLKKLQGNKLNQLELASVYLTEYDLIELVAAVRESAALKTLRLGHHAFKLSGTDFAYLDERFWKILRGFIQENTHEEKRNALLSSSGRISFMFDKTNSLYKKYGEFFVTCYGFTQMHVAALLDDKSLVAVFIKSGERFNKDNLGRFPDELALAQGHVTLAKYLKQQREQRALTHFMQDRAKEQVHVVDLAKQKEQLSKQISELAVKSQEVLLNVNEIQRYWIAIQKIHQSKVNLGGIIRGLDVLADELKAPHHWLNVKGLGERRLDKYSVAFKPLREHLERLKKLNKSVQVTRLQGESIATYISTVIDVLTDYRLRLCQLAAQERVQRMRLPALMFGAGLMPQLLDENASAKIAGKGASDSEYGTSSVHVLNDIHFKRDPYAPGIEYMVGYLSQLIMGEGTTPTELLKVIDGDGKSYAFIASKTVVGINLEDVLKRYPDFVEKVDATNFSLMILLSLLTDPEDAKPDNYMAALDVEQIDGKEQLRAARIIGIDNDIAFAAPIVMSHTGSRQGIHYVNVKNVLYFFPQMKQGIDAKAREVFLNRIPELVMLDWLSGLYHKNEEYLELRKQGVFTQEEYESGGRNGRGLQLPLRLEPGTTLKLYEKLCKLKDLLEAKPEITHQELFRVLEPILQRFYAECIQKAKAENQVALYDRSLKVKETDAGSERYAYIWQGIKMLYEQSAPSVEDVVNLRSHIQSSQVSSVMTSIALKTVQQRGYEQKRVLDIADAIEEFIGGIDYQRLTGELAEQLLAAIKKLTFIKQPLWHIAAAHRNRGMMRFLTMQKEPMDVQNERGLTALHLSASIGDKAGVSYLLRAGMSVDVRDKVYETPVYKTARRLKELKTLEQTRNLKTQDQLKKQQLQEVYIYLTSYQTGQVDNDEDSNSQTDIVEGKRLLRAQERLERLQQKGDVQRRLAEIEQQLEAEELPQVQKFGLMAEKEGYHKLLLRYQGEAIPPLMDLSVIELEQYVTLKLFISKIKKEAVTNLSDALSEVESRIRKLKEGCVKEEGQGLNYKVKQREMTAIEFERWVLLECIRAGINSTVVPELAEKLLQAQEYLKKLREQSVLYASDERYAKEREPNLRLQGSLQGLINRLGNLQQRPENVLPALTMSTTDSDYASDCFNTDEDVTKKAGSTNILSTEKPPMTAFNAYRANSRGAADKNTGGLDDAEYKQIEGEIGDSKSTIFSGRGVSSETGEHRGLSAAVLQSSLLSSHSASITKSRASRGWQLGIRTPPQVRTSTAQSDKGLSRGGEEPPADVQPAWKPSSPKGRRLSPGN